MTSLFLRQFGALFVKNWIVLAKRPYANLIRCLIMPIASAIFLAYAQVFLLRQQYAGLGSMVPIRQLADVYNPSLLLPWTDLTNGTASIDPASIMDRVTQDFSSKQRGSVFKTSLEDLASLCRENIVGSSSCFAAVSFEALPAEGSDGRQTLNYTIRADSGLTYIDVKGHTSDLEQRILPLQWAIESAIIEGDTGVTPSAPLEWPYTQFSLDEVFDNIRLAYINLVSGLLVIVFFVMFIGVAYHLPELAVGERAIGLTSHMKAMGLMDSARVLAWYLTLSLAYLPGWLIMAGIWHVKLWSGTNAGLLIAIHLLTGLSLTSWSMFIMAPFGKSAQLAAISANLIPIAFCVVGMVITEISTGTAFILIIFFPAYFYPVAIRCITDFELSSIPTSAWEGSPNEGLKLGPLLLAALISVFIWPVAGAQWEHWLYDAHNPSTGGYWGRRKKEDKDVAPPPPNTAISIRNLGKDFRTSIFKGKKGIVTAVSDLTLDIPKHGIFVLLGPNGAGKSTTMSILGGLTGRTRGTVLFEGGVEHPPRGSIGLVPQKNVLNPELTCYQTLRLWKTIKPQSDDDMTEDIIQLLKDCDLGSKVHSKAGTLSGGQKRKLQLAIGLIGGSQIVLVDECTSGVDPLSRRAIWKTLTSVKNDRTIVFTTHFLDEADLLADEIAVLAAPGRLVAHGSPVKLKSTLGEGYTLKVTFSPTVDKTASDTSVLDTVRAMAPQTHVSTLGPHELAYHLKTHDPAVVKQVLEGVERKKGELQIDSYAVSASTIEDIFLDLIQESEQADKKSTDSSKEDDDPPELPVVAPGPSAPQGTAATLSSGTQRTILGQALTIYHKRCLIARRSWLSYVIALAVITVASCVPLTFVPTDGQTCEVVTSEFPPQRLFIPDTGFWRVDPKFPYPITTPYVTPPGLLDALDIPTSAFQPQELQSNQSFVDEVNQNSLDIPDGGISVDVQSGSALFAWNVGRRTDGSIFLNAVSNLLYNKALNDTGKAGSSPKIIAARLGVFTSQSSGSLKPLQWAAFFGLGVAIFPAFFTLYVAQERRSSVQAMQFSNGISNPAGLWLGHVLFDSMFSVLAATILVIVFAAHSTIFQGLGYLWFILVLHGFTGTLFAYIVTLFVKSPITAFASLAAYQFVIFGLYLAGYLLSFTYALPVDSGRYMNIIHFTVSLVSPTLNVVRASFVSVNLFSLLCHNGAIVPSSSLGSITRYGGPILYLILHGLLLFAILVLADSGMLSRHTLISFLYLRPGRAAERNEETKDALVERPDVRAEAEAVRTSKDALRVLGVSKTFPGAGTVVDGVSFGVAQDTIFALLGPNGAGKTTTFNMIRGELKPTTGQIYINGNSITHDTRAARLSLGVCPQFTAIDAQLTVQEHLHIYARLKGLARGSVVRDNVQNVLAMTGLSAYADRLASRLSGGNQRKLALAIALVGNPSVLLIDEFSSGVDAKMKRDMWGTLKNVAVGKAIVITTHSMEEASTLANKVGIIAKHMLAVGTTDDLLSRYARYLVHFPGRTREDIARAQTLMARIPGARMANDVATRFEVPVGEGLSLAQLFGILADAAAESGVGEYAVENASLESVFMKVIRDNAVEEGDGEARARKGFSFFSKT